MYRKLISATCLFKLLNAFEASIKRMPSVFSASNTYLIAYTAASHPPSCPQQSWKGPAAFFTSSLTTVEIDLPMILLSTSQMPIGRTPGFLSKGINRHARYAVNKAGSTNCVASLRDTAAMEAHKSAVSVKTLSSFCSSEVYKGSWNKIEKPICLKCEIWC